MLELILGVLAFSCFVISDAGRLFRIHKSWGLLFGLGCVLLVYATVSMTPWGDLLSRDAAIRLIICGVIAAAALFALLRVVFFAVPSQGGTFPLPLCDTGAYALCRHPGVLCLGLFFLIWAILCQTVLSFLAFCLFTVLDILYVWWQDRFLFPKTIQNYDAYRRYTPFLIPNLSSIRRAFRRS